MSPSIRIIVDGDLLPDLDVSSRGPRDRTMADGPEWEARDVLGVIEDLTRKVAAFYGVSRPAGGAVTDDA